MPSSQDMGGLTFAESQAPLSQFSDLLTDLLSHASIRHYVTSLDPDEANTPFELASAPRRPLRVVFRSAVRMRMPSLVVQVTDLSRGGRPVAGHVRRIAPETGDTTVAFEPAADWQPGHRYKVTLNPAAVSVRGASLQPYHWEFTAKS